MSELNEVKKEIVDLKVQNAEIVVVLKNVLDTLKEESRNSTRITKLETNWRWAKGIAVAVVIPAIFIILRAILQYLS